MTLPLAPPAGMRDVLHPESAAIRAIGGRVGEVFASHGYDLVTTPPFEHAEVLERGLAAVDRRDLVRFVEPETGEVALLRPDITPQIARIVATRLADRPAPHRLRYQGTVVRRRHSRARRHRQLTQAGVEHVGTAGAEADVEALSLAASALCAAGLSAFHIELGQVRIGRAALSQVPAALRDRAALALGRKDAAALASLLDGAELARPRKILLALTELYGEPSVVDDARSLLDTDELCGALDELAVVIEGARSAGLGPRLLVDLGELRGMSYYTGVSFTLLADGPGEAVGAGGRYDDLLARFDAPAPATGFALDLDNLSWALASAGQRIEAGPLRVAVIGSSASSTADLLRAGGAVAARLPDDVDPLAFARAWDYDCVLVTDGAGTSAQRASDGSQRKLDVGPDVRSLTEWVRGAVSTGPSGTVGAAGEPRSEAKGTRILPEES